MFLTQEYCRLKWNAESIDNSGIFHRKQLVPRYIVLFYVPNSQIVPSLTIVRDKRLQTFCRSIYIYIMEHKRIILVTFSDWWWADMQMKIFKHHETLWRSDSYCWLILRWSGNEKWWRYLNYAYRSLLHCTYIWLCQVTYKIFHRLLWQTQNDGHSSNSFRCFFVDSWYIFRL